MPERSLPYRETDWSFRMTLFHRIFTTRVLVLIICLLAAALASKASAYYDVDWTAAMVAQPE